MVLKEVLMGDKRYPEEFNIEAVKQATDRDSVADVAKWLDITPTVFMPRSRSTAPIQSNIK